jgi:hypothetical protein
VAEASEATTEEASRLDPHRAVVDNWLRDELDAPRKQRHTAKRIFDRLLDEHDATDVSYGMVREYVATRRREIRLRRELVTCAPFCLRLSDSGKAIHRISASAGQEAFTEGLRAAQWRVHAGHHWPGTWPAAVAQIDESVRIRGDGWRYPRSPLDSDGVPNPRATDHPYQTITRPIRPASPAAAALPHCYVLCTNKPPGWPFSPVLELCAARARADG